MGKGKQKANMKITINGEELKYVHTATYLGFNITFNMSTKAMMEDRILKANRATYMLKRALSVQGNVSVSLATNLFDKLMAPILLYGCCVWALPKTTRCIYVNNIPEQNNCLAEVRKLFSPIIKDVHIESARRTGKNKSDQNRRVLVALGNIQDKLTIMSNMRARVGAVTVDNYDVDIENTIYERVHSNFLKFVLNVNKYSSNIAVRGELGRFPTTIKALSLSVKYWHNIITGKSPNSLLRHAFNSMATYQSDPIQATHYILRTNGYDYITTNPASTTNTNIYKCLKKRLEDQYIQGWFRRVADSKFLSTLK